MAKKNEFWKAVDGVIDLQRFLASCEPKDHPEIERARRGLMQARMAFSALALELEKQPPKKFMGFF